MMVEMLNWENVLHSTLSLRLIVTLDALLLFIIFAQKNSVQMALCKFKIYARTLINFIKGICHVTLQ